MCGAPCSPQFAAFDNMFMYHIDSRREQSDNHYKYLCIGEGSSTSCVVEMGLREGSGRPAFNSRDGDLLSVHRCLRCNPTCNSYNKSCRTSDYTSWWLNTKWFTLNSSTNSKDQITYPGVAYINGSTQRSTIQWRHSGTHTRHLSSGFSLFWMGEVCYQIKLYDYQLKQKRANVWK